MLSVAAWYDNEMGYSTQEGLHGWNETGVHYLPLSRLANLGGSHCRQAHPSILRRPQTSNLLGVAGLQHLLNTSCDTDRPGYVVRMAAPACLAIRQ